MRTIRRTALLVLATISATAVAPAEMTPSMESQNLITAAATPTLALPPVEDLLEAEATGDPLAPLPLEEDVVEEESLPDDLHGLVSHFWGDSPRDRQMECLAGAVYFETRGEPLEGQLAVAQVVANRAASSRFPDDYCGVVYQRHQFSFVRGGKMPRIKRGSKAWKRAVAIARIVDGEHLDSSVPDALFFHARYVNPRWRLTRIGDVGNHIFYR
jgi:N-acetylmuramoyl-L-alanine amidase